MLFRSEEAQGIRHHQGEEALHRPAQDQAGGDAQPQGKAHREFATKTKKLGTKQRAQARKEFKKKVDTRYRELVTRFPPARGLRDLATVLQLIKKIENVRMAQ